MTEHVPVCLHAKPERERCPPQRQNEHDTKADTGPKSAIVTTQMELQRWLEPSRADGWTSRRRTARHHARSPLALKLHGA